jgi:hypothetical protein
MKKLIMLSVFGLGALSAQAGELDGTHFCRKVKSDGSFGQPRGEREHCVSFEEDSMVDNASTFFGNPPKSISYVLVGDKILIVDDGELSSPYKYSSKDKTLTNSAGAVLKVKKVSPNS